MHPRAPSAHVRRGRRDRADEERPRQRSRGVIEIFLWSTHRPASTDRKRSRRGECVGSASGEMRCAPPDAVACHESAEAHVRRGMRNNPLMTQLRVYRLPRRWSFAKNFDGPGAFRSLISSSGPPRHAARVTPPASDFRDPVPRRDRGSRSRTHLSPSRATFVRLHHGRESAKADFVWLLQRFQPPFPSSLATLGTWHLALSHSRP